MLDQTTTLADEILASGLFDAKWYLATYNDVARSGLDPLAHFIRFGMLMKRSPGPSFDSRFYLARYPDVLKAGIPAALHYIRYGREEGRFVLPSQAVSEVQNTPDIPAYPRWSPAQAHWAWRLGTDAFMLRGLSPMAPLAVVVNAANEADWTAARAALSSLGSDEALDLFLLGPVDELDFFDLPKTLRSTTHLGSADESGNAQGFVRAGASGCFDPYEALLWISPCGEQVQTTTLAADFRSAANWGWSAETTFRLDPATDDEAAKPLLNAMRTALPRLGLSLGEKALDIPAGGAVWLKPILLRALGPTVRPFEMKAEGQGGFPGRSTVLAMLAFAAREAEMVTATATVPAAAAERQVKAVAFYLPQFHPIPENNKWWGKGFTEWSNVTLGAQLFRNHYQPRVPADLGYYDLRLEDVQVAQGDLARQFGIHGFCYYYYWFNGKKLLNQPIEQMAQSTRTDAGFCVCWANENWSRNWDGQNRHVLMKQDYSLDSNIALMRELIPMMKDPRWVRYNGKPVMVVYRISIIPNWMETARRWREECRVAGLGEIHLCAVRFGLETLQGQPQEYGLDSYVLFPPHEASRKDLRSAVLDLHKDFGGEIFDYSAVVDGDIEKYADGYDWPVHRGAMLGWDNTARRLTNARIFHGATPYGFRRWIKGILEQEARFNAGSESLVFINAWNEWAEGTYLEPDQRWGTSNLKAFVSAVRAVPGTRTVPVEKGTALKPKAQAALAIQASPLDNGAIALKAPAWNPGTRAHDPSLPTVLLCAHISGHHLFGGERSFLDVLDALSNMPLNVVVTLPSGNNRAYLDEVVKRCTGTYVFPYPQWMDNRATYGWLSNGFADIIARHAVDIVHANTIVLLEPVIAAHRMGRLALIHSRELISLDDPLRDRMGQTTADIVNKVLRRTDWVVGNSQATCRLFSKGDRTLYVPNAVSLSELEMGNSFSNVINFGIISSNIPKKGVADFVEVARRAAERAPRARFVVVGPHNEQIDRWNAEVKHGERPDNIIFAGYRETPREAMTELNVLLNLSHFAESFGRTLAEAMAARRPVIAYDWGALPELVRHGETGFLVPYRDIDGVVDAVVALCDNSDRILEMGEKGRDFVAANFSKKVLCRALAAGYERILNRPMQGQPMLETPRATPHVPAAIRIGMAPRTTVVIPVYNAPEEVKHCIASVLQHTDLSRDRVLVIDDGSPDPEVAPMLDTFKGQPGLTILRNDSNIGYTRTVNFGITEAGHDDVVLLNSDTIATPKWLEGLRATAYSREKVATATAMSDNAGAFSFPSFNEHCPKPNHLSHEEYALMVLQATQDCAAPEVPTGSGFCMYIRRALVDECGLFDYEGFPRGYGEENDFCMRALKAGWVNLVSPWSFVYHIRTASFKGEKTALVKAGVDVVTKRYPNYSQLVKQAFDSADMLALRRAAEQV